MQIRSQTDGFAQDHSFNPTVSQSNLILWYSLNVSLVAMDGGGNLGIDAFGKHK
jgi:hypothetical protein